MVRWRHNVPAREVGTSREAYGPDSGDGPDQLPSSNPASAAKMPNTRRPHIPLATGRAAVEAGRVVADTGRQLAVDVDLVDAGRLQGVALQVQRLRAVGLRDDAGTGQDAAARVQVCRSAASGALPPRSSR